MFLGENNTEKMSLHLKMYYKTIQYRLGNIYKWERFKLEKKITPFSTSSGRVEVS